MSTVSESLSQLEVLVVDCQATAAAPHGHLLEMGWARAGTTTTRADARLIALPHGEHKLRRAQIVAHTTVDKDLAVLKAFCARPDQLVRGAQFSGLESGLSGEVLQRR